MNRFVTSAPWLPRCNLNFGEPRLQLDRSRKLRLAPALFAATKVKLIRRSGWQLFSCSECRGNASGWDSWAFASFVSENRNGLFRQPANAHSWPLIDPTRWACSTPRTSRVHTWMHMGLRHTWCDARLTRLTSRGDFSCEGKGEARETGSVLVLGKAQFRSAFN